MTTEQCDLDIEERNTMYILEDLLDTVNDPGFDIDTICDIVRLNVEELIDRYRQNLLQQ